MHKHINKLQRPAKDSIKLEIHVAETAAGKQVKLKVIEESLAAL